MKKLLITIVVFCLSVSFSPRQITWVAIGDSITYLNDHANETGNRVTKGYLTRVTEKLPNIHYINQGHNGWTSGEIADNIEKLAIIKADVYSIFLGTNDWWQGRPLGSLKDYENNSGNSTVYGSYRIIVNKLRNLNKDAKIILITPMQRADFVYVGDMKNNAYGSYKEKKTQLLEQFAKAVDSIGKLEYFDVVDLYNNSDLSIKNLVKFKRIKDLQTGAYKNYAYPDYIGLPFNPARDEYPYPFEAIGMTFDGLHPSDNGNEKIAELMVKIMKHY